MRLQLNLPQVKPTKFKKPLVCPHRDCQGKYFEHHQEVDAETLKNWLEPVAKAVDAEILVSDDADAFKTVANDLGLAHKSAKAT